MAVYQDLVDQSLPYPGTDLEPFEEDIQKLGVIQVPEDRIQALIDLIRSTWPGIPSAHGEPADGGDLGLGECAAWPGLPRIWRSPR